MCRRVGCRKCGKVSWAGCGAHVDAVLRGVPQEERCVCSSSAATAATGSGGSEGWMKSLFRWMGPPR